MQVFIIYTDEIQYRIDPLYYSGAAFMTIKQVRYNTKKLSEIALYFKTGFAAGKQDQDETQKGIIQIRPTNLDAEGNIYFDKKIYISENSEKVNTYLLQRQEVLFNNINSQELVGKTVYFDIEGKYFCSNHITRIGVDKKIILPEYLQIVLNLYQRRKVFFNICTNWNNQSGVNIELLKILDIPVPDLPIQKEIITLLDSAYQQKRQREKAAQKLLYSTDEFVLNELGIQLPEVNDEMVFVIKSDEITGKRVDARYNQPKFKVIQKSLQKSKYPIKLLKEFIIRIHYGASLKNNYVDDGIPLLRITNIKPNFIDTTDIIKLPESQRRAIGSGFVYKDDLLISRSGTIGIVVVVPETANGYAFGSFMIKFCLNNQINKRFVAIWLNNKFAKILTERDRIGAIQGNITIDTIENFKIPYPSLNIQSKIVERVEHLTSQAKKLHEESIEVLEEAKKQVEEMLLVEN
jgi:type I restriction enzyme S subunit